MSVDVFFTPYGPSATALLGERIAELKGGDPLAPVTVVAPTNLAGVGARRALGARSGGIAAVNFLKLFDVAERLARHRSAGADERPLSAPVLAAAVRRVLDAEPGMFRLVARHPATEQALVRSYRELRDLSEDALVTLASQSRRASEVVRIYRRTRETLLGRWIDERDLVDAAIEALAAGEEAVTTADLGSLVIYLPQRVTTAQGRLVASLGDVTRVTVVVGLSGDRRADALVQESLRRMGVLAGEQPPQTKAHGHRVVSTSDADEEVRAAVRQVVNAARAGIPLARIAILYGAQEPYASLLHEHLRSACIAFNGPSDHTPAGSILGRGLLTLLDLDSRGFRRSDVFALLAVVSPTLPSGDAVHVAGWERISRRAGVVRGVEQWGERLGRFATEQREAAEHERADPDGSDWRAERQEREADQADDLTGFMVRLMRDLRPDQVPKSWEEMCTWARRLIDTYIGDEQSRQQWPEVEKQAAETVLDVLAHLASLDEIDSQPSLAIFRSAVAQELGASAGRIGRVGRGVTTGPIGGSLAMDLDVVVLLGLAEGVFPHQSLDDPLLPDREREVTGGELKLLSDRRDEQHLDLLVTLASAGTGVLVFARGDLQRGAEQAASRWLLDTASELAGRPVAAGELGSLNTDWLEHVPSFAGGMAGADFPATEQEFRLQAFARRGASAEQLQNHPLIGDDPILARGSELSLARASDRFTRFDGNLSGVQTPLAAEEVLSVTRLETWAKCPLRYLLQHVLGVQPMEQPEQLLEISRLEKGSLIHSILDRFLQDELDASTVPQSDDPWSQQQRARLIEIGRELCGQAEAQGLTGKPVYWYHDRNQILADLGRFLDEDNDRRAKQRATPIASELSFGMPVDELAPIPVTLADGRPILFRGRADRVDRDESGGLIVVDYKTGKTTAQHTKLPQTSGDPHEEEPEVDFVQRGTLLQLPVYGRAAQARETVPDAPVNVHYWFVTDAGRFDVRGYPLTEAVHKRFSEVVTTIVEGIEEGVFCDRPELGDGRYGPWCDYCNADTLGTDDRRKEWERKRDEPELAAYRGLAEPAAEARAEI